MYGLAIRLMYCKTLPLLTVTSTVLALGTGLKSIQLPMSLGDAVTVLPSMLKTTFSERIFSALIWLGSRSLEVIDGSSLVASSISGLAEKIEAEFTMVA